MTQGQIEDFISKTVIRYQCEYAGRGPLEVRTYLLDDLIVVRLHDVLTAIEKTLLQQPSGRENSHLVKQVRTEWIEKVEDRLVAALEEAIGAKVQSVHADVSTRTGEGVMVFVLDREVEWEQGTGKR